MLRGIQREMERSMEQGRKNRDSEVEGFLDIVFLSVIAYVHTSSAINK